MTVLISSSDLEKCISLSSMLKRKATIWVGQSCITRFVLKFCPSESVFSLNGSISLQIPLLCYFVNVGGLPIHPCPKSLLMSSYPEVCYQSILAAPGPTVRMWCQNDDGTSMLLEDVSDPIPLKPLWMNIVVDCTKKN